MINLSDYIFAGPPAKPDWYTVEELNEPSVTADQLWAQLLLMSFESIDDEIFMDQFRHLFGDWHECSLPQIRALEVRADAVLPLGHRLKAAQVEFTPRELMEWGASAPIVVRPSRKSPNGCYAMDFDAVMELVGARSRVNETHQENPGP